MQRHHMIQESVKGIFGLTVLLFQIRFSAIIFCTYANLSNSVKLNLVCISDPMFNPKIDTFLKPDGPKRGVY